jgi:predicted alpha-1,6-mannanase (GH76 family)
MTLLLALMLLGGRVTAADAPSLSPRTDLSAAASQLRADAAIQSFLLKFWDPERGYLRADFPGRGHLTGYWTYARGWDAVIASVDRTRGQRYAGWVETLYNGQNARGWHSDFYDDENWMALALLHAYSVAREKRYLDRAESLFASIRNAWDTSCCGSVPGGIWWDRRHTQKATASNAGPVITACQLYAATGNRVYLEFARQVYTFWWRQMVDPTTFQVADHLDPSGRKVWWKFTYNEGLMIGASRELYLRTRDPQFLTNAHRIAGFMVRSEVVSSPCGPVLFDGANNRCRGDAQEFKALAYHELCELQRLSPRSEYAAVLIGSARSLWELARNRDEDLFAANWAGPPQAGSSDRQQNAAALALSDYAQQQGAYGAPAVPIRRYEAEDNTLSALSVENRHRGFTGWGYVAGWNAEGQAITFHPKLTPGKHTLSFRYAAGAGDARRALSIDGRSTPVRLRFPGTGSWDAYLTARVTVRFPADVHSVSLVYGASRGSTNFLNLDSLTVD